MFSGICASGDCQVGKASVDQMGKTFNVLLSTPGFDRAHFEPLVLSIEQTFDETYAFYSPYIPFNPTCCAVLELGKQADKINNDMLASVGAETLPGGGPSTTPGGGVDMQSLVTLGMIVAGAVIIGNVAPLIRKR